MVAAQQGRAQRVSPPTPMADAPGVGWAVRQHCVRRPITSESKSPGFKSQGKTVYLPCTPVLSSVRQACEPLDSQEVGAEVRTTRALKCPLGAAFCGTESEQRGWTQRCPPAPISSHRPAAQGEQVTSLSSLGFLIYKRRIRAGLIWVLVRCSNSY